MVAPIKHFAAVIAASVLGFVVLLTWATPASAAAVGLTAGCTLTSATAQCNFPVLSASYNAEIHYVTVQCSTTSTTAYNLKEVEVAAIPPQASGDVDYEMAGNRASVAGVANVGAIVDIYVKANTTSAILIDLSVVPTGTTCTASLTATY